MESEGENKKISFSIDVGEGKKLRLIDISSEDDYLIASPLFDSLEDLRLSVTLDRTNALESLNSLGIETSIAAQNASEILHQSEQKFLSSDTMEPGRPSYLRKSLAWDSAFFTNAGVLDPDELLLINKGFKSRPPRGIQEAVNVWRSESGSTIHGDGFKVEGSDGDPFQDVRASIQRSGKMFNVGNASCASASRQAGLKNIQASKNVDIRSQMKSKPVSKEQSITIQSSKKSKNEQTARSGERHRLPLKPPRVSGQVKGISTGQNKGSLMGKQHDRVIIEEKSAGTRSVQSLTVCKKFSSSVSSTANRHSDLSCSSDNSPRRAISPNVSSNHLKRKIESRNSKLSASVSTSKTPSRYSGKSNWPATLSLSTKSLSMSKHSSGQSPASSTDDCSLFPSRKKECIDLKPNPETTTTARRKYLQHESREASDLQSNLHNQSSFYEEIEISSPLQSNTVCVPETCSESVESFKQSGLRMPSPKIGFFDEDKSVVRKVRGGLQIPLRMRSTSPKKNVDSGRKTPAKLTKLGTAETGNVKRVSQDSGIQHPNSRVQPRHTSSYGKLKRSSPVGSVFTRNPPDRAATRYIGTPTGMEGENCSKSRKIGAGEHDRRKISQSSSSRTEERRLEGISRDKLDNESKGQKGKGSIDHTKGNEKRNSSKNGAQVNELSKFLEVIDLNRDMVMELKQRSYSAPSFSEEHILHNQLQDLPNTLSESDPLPFTEVILSTRTPLGDKTSVCNRSGTYELSMDPTREKSSEKHQYFSSFEDIDKENI